MEQVLRAHAEAASKLCFMHFPLLTPSESTIVIPTLLLTFCEKIGKVNKILSQKLFVKSILDPNILFYVS